MTKNHLPPHNTHYEMDLNNDAIFKKNAITGT